MSPLSCASRCPQRIWFFRFGSIEPLSLTKSEDLAFGWKVFIDYPVQLSGFDLLAFRHLR